MDYGNPSEKKGIWPHPDNWGMNFRESHLQPRKSQHRKQNQKDKNEAASSLLLVIAAFSWSPLPTGQIDLHSQDNQISVTQTSEIIKVKGTTSTKHLSKSQTWRNRSRVVVTRGWGRGGAVKEMEGYWSKIQMSSYEINKFGGSNVQHVDYS